MKKIMLMLLFSAASYTCTKAQYVSLSTDEFARLKTLVATEEMVKIAYKTFQTTADASLNETPNPIEEIISEGRLTTDPEKIKTVKSLADINKIYALALVYKVNGNKTYLDKVSEYLMAWAKVNRSNADPIDDTKLEDVIAAYDMVRGDVKPEVKKAVDNWLQNTADAELDSKYAKSGKGTATNNWNSHRIKIITLIVYTLHNDKYYKVAERELTKQIGVNLYADGTGADFMERDAFHYHIYTLEPMISSAMAIYRATGKDYFNYEAGSGASIKKSVDFMVPYVTGEKTHGEFQNSTVAFDRARAKNGEKEYQAGSKFKPLSGLHVLEQAAYFNPKYMNVVKQVTPAGDSHNYDWEIVLNKVRTPFAAK